MPIGPSTVATGFDASATGIEQQRKVFKNPRGLGYYYALVWESDNYWYFYYSQDGTSWTKDRAIGYLGPREHSLWIAEDSGNERLIVYVIGKGGLTLVRLKAYLIIDTGFTVGAELFDDIVASATDDAIHNPSVTLDSSGYVWVTWTDEFTNKGKQRSDVYAKHTQEAYPTSAPTWSAAVKVYDGATESNGMMSKVEVVPLTATADVGFVYSLYNYTNTIYEIRAKTGTRAVPLSGTPTTGDEVVLDATIHADLNHSSVAESATASDVFIGYKDSNGDFLCRKWDISEDTSAAFGTIHGATDVDSLALSIDKNADPDVLYAFYVKNGEVGDVFYKTIDVDDTITWLSTYSAGSDPNNHWTDDANAWDNEMSTYATGDQTAGEDGRLVSTTVRESSEKGTIVKVEIGGWLGGGGVGESPIWVVRPVFDGVLGASTYVLGGFMEPFEAFEDITNDGNAPSPWTWADIQLVDIRLWDSLGKPQGMYEFKIKVTCDWSSETKIDDDGEYLDHLSASYQDWVLDGDVQIIYARQTNYTVRFWAVGVGGQTYQKTYQVDALFKKLGIQKTPTIDAAFQRKDIQESLDIDSLFSLRIEKTADIDSVFQRQYELQRQVDAVFRRLGIEKTPIIDALIVLRLQESFDLDTLLAKLGIEKTADVDTLFKRLDIEKTTSIDALLKGIGVEKTASVDALLQKLGIEKTRSIDTLLVLRTQKTWDLDAYFLKTTTEDILIDVLFVLSVTAEFSLDALFKRLDILATFGIDADFLKENIEVQRQVDALFRRLDILESFGIDVALLKENVVKSFAIDVRFGAAQTYELSRQVDTLFKRLGIEETVSIDALLKRLGIGKTADVNAFFERLDIPLTAAVDALLKRLGVERTASVDALFKKIGLETASLDALIVLRTQKTAVIDALLSTTVTKQALVDAIFLSFTLKTFDLDTLIQAKGLELQRQMDTILQRTVPADILLDIVLKGVGVQRGFGLKAHFWIPWYDEIVVLQFGGEAVEVTLAEKEMLLELGCKEEEAKLSKKEIELKMGESEI